ncbi:hypothetical protein UlMin_012422 [Ulmus minor]
MKVDIKLSLLPEAKFIQSILGNLWWIGSSWFIHFTSKIYGSLIEPPLQEKWAFVAIGNFFKIIACLLSRILPVWKSTKTTPPYRVILHNDNFNKWEYVVQVLMKVIPGMTLDSAVNIMQESHYNGLSVVIICAQADAEQHCMQLQGNGLLISIEPASGGC